MKLFKLSLALVCAGWLAACSTTEEDEATRVAELPEFQAKFSVQVKWESSVGDGIEHYFSRLMPVVAYGKVYSASRQGEVVALDVNSGKTVWQNDLSTLAGEGGFFKRAPSARVAGGPVVDNGRVFYGTENGYVYALDAESGKLLWRQSVKGEVISAPATDGNRLVVNTASGVLSALNVETGDVLWTAEQEVPPLTLRGTSGVATDSGGALIGEASGQLSVYLTDNGQKGWSAEVGEPTGATELERVIDVDTTPLIYGDKVYAISARGNLVAVDLRSGRTVWKRQYSSYHDLSIDRNSIFATDVKGHVYAIDRNNGLEKWGQLSLTNRGVTGPAPIGDYVVVGDFEGYLHWLDQETGEFVARHRVDSSGIYVMPTVNNGVVYSQARNGDLQAIITP